MAPLTPAEKQKRYREKIKKDPERYAVQKKKDLDRIRKNMKVKKIGEMNEEEKNEQRKIWREKKNKQKQNKLEIKKQEDENKKREKETKKETKTNAKILKEKQRVTRKYNRAVTRIKKLKNRLDYEIRKYKKLKTSSEDTVRNLEEIIKKKDAREEILEIAIRHAYKHGSRTEKKIFKNIAMQKIVTTNKAKSYVAKLMGLRGKVRQKKIKSPKELETDKQIQAFFIRDDISRCTSGKKECITKKKNKQQRRYLLDTLWNLYKIYKEEGGKSSFSTFYKYKPFFVLSPGLTNRETCLCIKHSNMDMLFIALKRNGFIYYKNMTELITDLVCDRKQFECMYDECEKCRGQKINY